MNINKLPTHDDYEFHHNWTVILQAILDDSSNLRSISALRNSDFFPHFTLCDYRRVVEDIKDIMDAYATDVLHPSQHLAVNVSFEKAREMQNVLTEAGFKITIFPTTCY
tara:strand:- start:185 stop:511 length:327 start_codon:yes stop_codon:yes gene_type:complete